MELITSPPCDRVFRTCPARGKCRGKCEDETLSGIKIIINLKIHS